MARTQQDVVTAARSLVGTPFHHAGRLPGIGIDCIGVAAVTGTLCGFQVDDVLTYPLRPNGMLPPIVAARFVQVTEKQPGDVLLMAFDGLQPHHLAIYTGETIIHAHAKARRCVEQAYDDWWRDRTVAVYRYKELT